MSRPPNILLVTVDSLRKDRLPFYGCRRQTAPFLSRLARGSAVFDAMYSQYVCTPPAMSSLMTGRFPSFVGVDDWNENTWHGLTRFYSHKGERGVPAALTPLAERLRRNGYRTAAFVSTPFLSEGFGFDRGFSDFRRFREEGGEAKSYADRFIRSAGEWLVKKGREPFFLFMHLMDTHFPLPAAPSAFPSRRERIKGKELDGRVQTALGELHRTLSRFGEKRIDPGALLDLGDGLRVSVGRAVRHYQAMYDDAIHFLDLCLAGLHRQLASRGLDRSTLWIVSADHGEEFLETGYLSHNAFSGGPLHLVQVPFLLHWPGKLKAARLPQVARMVDLYPTLLEIAACEPAECDGLSLLPLLKGKEDSPRIQQINLCHPRQLHLIYDRRWKYTASLKDGWERIDPLHPGRTAAAGRRETQSLLRFFRLEKDKFAAETKSPPQFARESGAETDPESLAQMRALGYL